MLRDYIVEHGERFEAVISDQNFMEYFTVKGDALKKVPQGYDETHPQAEYLKNKSWYLEYPVPDILIEDLDVFIERATEIFLFMKPFNDFLNDALKDFQMPSRQG